MGTPNSMHLQPGSLPRRGVTAVATDYQIRSNLYGVPGRSRLHSRNPSPVNQARLPHAAFEDRKSRKLLRLLGNEVQEVPLRHQRDEFAMSGHMAEFAA